MLTCARSTRPEAHRDHQQLVADGLFAEQLRKHGLAAVDGLGSREAVLAFARQVMALVPHRDSEPDALTTIRDIGQRAQQPGLAGLGSGELLAHTEGSSVPEPPRLMLLVCLQQPASGGEVFLVDGQAVHKYLTTAAPEAVDLMSQPRTAFYGDGGGYPAQIFTRRPDGRASVRYRQDELAQFSPVVSRCLPVLKEAIAAHQQVVSLSPGQGYLLDNQRYLHGRAAFSGPRLYVRALGAPLFPLQPGFGAGGAGSNGRRTP